MAAIVYDTEIFENLFLVCLYDPEAGCFRDFRYTGERNESKELRTALETAEALISFNGLGFDNHLLNHFLNCGNVPSTKKLADDIIKRREYRKPTRFGPKMKLTCVSSWIGRRV